MVKTIFNPMKAKGIRQKKREHFSGLAPNSNRFQFGVKEDSRRIPKKEKGEVLFLV